jgi:outer membrane protein OmpA-like peptidoglycan-associated protein
MRNRALLIVLALLLVVAACKKKEPVSPVPPPASSPESTSTATTPASAAPSQDADDLAGISQGASIARAAESIEAGAGSYRVIDEDATAGWTSAEGKATSQSIVIQLAERCAIERVSFDTAVSELDTHSPKDVLVEISDTSADAGFSTISSVSLIAQKDGQTFATSAQTPGRFLKLTIVSNYGGGVTQVGEFRAFGKKLTNTPPPNVTGTYHSEDLGDFHLKQDGAQVTGCYDNAVTPLTGGVEGHVLRFGYATETEKGPAIIAFSADGRHGFGGYWKTNGVEEHPKMFAFELARTSDDAGKCSGDPQGDATAALEKDKRLRLYGINFDSDSDKLRDESKPTLDLLVAILKARAAWKLTIEGHTDSTSTPQHNEQLSLARANAVKNALVAAGIEGARLTTAGLGSTKPVATNDTALGRAANRRVEVAR